jgi:hypothetical protein
MSTLSLTLAANRPLRYRAGFRLLNEIGRMFASIAAAQRAAADYRQLSSHTDVQLANEGMTREDVARVVYERHFD